MMNKPLAVLALIFILGGSILIFISFKSEKSDAVDYSYLPANTKAKIAGYECGVESKKSKFFINKEGWSTSGEWIAKGSLVRVASITKQPFIMKIGDNEKRATLNGASFVAYLAFTGGDFETQTEIEGQKITLVPIVTASPDFYVVQDNFINGRGEEQLFVKNAEDATSDTQEVFVCIDDVVYIDKAKLAVVE